MSMTFFFLLRESGFDWDLAKEVFYNLTDLQIAWLNRMFKRSEAGRRTSFGPGETIKSFDLRGRP